MGVYEDRRLASLRHFRLPEIINNLVLIVRVDWALFNDGPTPYVLTSVVSYLGDQKMPGPAPGLTLQPRKLSSEPGDYQ